MREQAVILETVHGSRAYGLETPESDIDRKGVFVAAPEAYLGYLASPEQIEPEQEVVYYEIRKFFRLAADCNPTVIELLFTADEDVRICDAEGLLLRKNRDLFLSRRAGGSFGRYGLSQLRRIRTHRRWLLSPPAKRPERADYGLPERQTVSRDQMGAAEALLKDGRMGEGELTPNFLEVMDRERRYRSASAEWQQYRTWLDNRNPRRAELERHFGYDTKHAMHLVRLLRMADEILSTGEVHVRRKDASELRAIREGVLPFDDLMAIAESLGERLDDLANKSALPEEPDAVRLNEVCAEIVSRVIARRP
jgi:predicted nucleotidyltransferase